MTVTPELVLQAVRRLGFAADDAREMALGFTNTVFRAGDYVVRVSREPEYEPLHELEAAVVPFARQAGVKTPDLLARDDSRLVIPAVFSVYPWVPGQTLGSQRASMPLWREVAREMGREVAKLHLLEEAPDIEPAWWPAPEESIETLVARELFSPAEGEALYAWHKRLRTAAPEHDPILTHNDLHPWNVLVEHGDFSTILDWANAGLGDPALDFAGLPIDLIPAMMEGYGENVDPPGFFEAAILRRWLGRALEEMTVLESDQAAYPRAWRRWPSGGLAEVWLVLQNSGPDWSIWSPE